MKFLKAFLFFIFVALIVLLLLFGCKRDKKTPDAATVDDDDSIENLDDDDDDDEFVDDEEIIRQAEEVGGTGDIKVTLLWDFPADLDLHVLQPNGNEIYYSNRRDPSTGGQLDTDNTHGGRGSAENIYWQNPPHGDYLVSVVYYSEKNNVHGGDFSVILFSGETVIEGPVRKHINAAGQTVNIWRFHYPFEGRRR